MGHGRDHEIHVIHIGFGRREGRTVNDNSVAVGGLGGDRGDDVTVDGDMEAGRKRGAEGMVVGQVENGGVLVRGRRGVHDGRGFRRGVEVRPALSVGCFRVLQRVNFGCARWHCWESAPLQLARPIYSTDLLSISHQEATPRRMMRWYMMISNRITSIGEWAMKLAGITTALDQIGQ